MDTDSGITSGDEPQHDVNTDEGFRRHLEAQVGGAELIHSKNEWGAPNSAHRKAKVADMMAEGQRKAEARVASLADFEAVITAPGPGNVMAGLEVPDDSPPAPAPVVDTAEVDRLKRELTATRTDLSEASWWEAQQLARDALEDAETDQDVHVALAQLRDDAPSQADFAQFTMEEVAGGLIQPEELELSGQLYASEKAFDAAQAQAAKTQAEMDALAEAQWKVLEGEQKRLGLNEDGWTAHLVDVAEAAGQLGVDLASLPKDEYESEIKNISALVADARRAYKHAWIQEQILDSGSSVEDGLTVMGQPVTPREPIEPRLDFGRMLAHSNRGKPVDVAGGVLAEAAKSTDKAETIQALARKADRDAEAKQARALKARGGF